MRNLFLIHLFFIVLFFGCRKNNQNVNPIPYVPVNITLYASNPDYQPLNAIGNYIYVNGGSRGIIVYRKSLEEFVALDRHSTYESEKACAIVTVEANNVTAIDDCSGSRFLISDGSVVEGPAVYPLVSYPTTFDGNVLRITN
jgi:nitrite reductase/ring-hydroxylating ferredoxin subunit